MELRLETPVKFQHPCYEVLTWFAARNLLKEIKGVHHTTLQPGGVGLVSFPDPAPLRGKEGLGTLVDFLGILCVSNHVTHAYAHAHFSNKRVIRELRTLCRGQGAGFG